MRRRFLEILETPGVRAAQESAYGRVRSRPQPAGRPLTGLTADEAAFIAARDSFYLASISESGWPYVQHRGGPPGFLRVLDDRHLAFADRGGNRQLLTTGNIAHDDRVCLFLMDYAARERLKILARASLLAPGDARLNRLSDPEEIAPERGFLLEVEGYDWNCPKFITPRYTRAEVDAVIDPLRARIRELEAKLGHPPSS